MPDEYDQAADFRAIADLRERARRARYVAWNVSDKHASNELIRHAQELEGRADALEARYILPPAATVPSGEPPIVQVAAALKPERPLEPTPGSAPDPSSDEAEPEPA